jgi:hypothetical protein
MALVEKNLGQALLTTGGNTVLRTVPANKTDIVKHIHIVNVTTSPITVSLWIDANGNSATDTEAILDAYPIAPLDFFDLNVYLVVETTGVIQAIASAVNSAAIIVSGAEIG